MTIEFVAKSVTVEAENPWEVKVSVEIEDPGAILESIPIKDAIAFYDSDELLDEIGEDAAKDRFGLVDPADEEE